jgi:hypothetical protein
LDKLWDLEHRIYNVVHVKTVDEIFLDKLETLEEIRGYYSGKYPVYVYDV